MIKMAEKNFERDDEASFASLPLKRKEGIIARLKAPLLGLVFSITSLIYIVFTKILTLNTIILSIVVSLLLISLYLTIMKVLKRAILLLAKADETTLIKDGKVLIRIDEKSLTAKAYSAFEISELPLRIQGKLRYFVRSAMIENIPFFYTILNYPINKSQKIISSGLSKEKRGIALVSHYGLWKSAIIIGTFVESRIIPGWLEKISNKIERNMSILMASFLSAFPHTRIRRLGAKELSLILDGSPPLLSSFYLWGIEVERFIDISPMFIKNIRTVLPSEFIVPQSVESDIDIGFIYDPEGINEEKLKEKAGFKWDNLLTSNTIIAADNKEIVELINYKILKKAIIDNIRYIIIADSDSKLLRIRDFKDLPRYIIGYNASINILNPSQKSNIQGYIRFLLLALTLSNYISNPADPNLFLVLQRGFEDAEPTVDTLIGIIDGMLTEPLPYKVKAELQNFRNFLLSIVVDKNRRFYLSDSIKFEEALYKSNIIFFGVKRELFLHSLIFYFILYRILTSKRKNEKIIVLVDSVENFLSNKAPELLTSLIKELNKVGILFHFSTTMPSKIARDIYSLCDNFAVGELKALDDAKIIAGYIRLSEAGEGLYSEHRHKIQQISFLRTMGNDRVLLYRKDLQLPIPLILEYENIEEESDFLKEPNQLALPQENYDLLALEFRDLKDSVIRILTWLDEMPLTLLALANILEDLSFDTLKRIIKRLQELSLVKPIITFTGSSKRIQFELTERGRKALERAISLK